MRRLTTQEFLRRAHEVHGNIYNYHEHYISSDRHMSINCNIHGDFSQRPNDHIRGQGCPLCGKQSMAKIKRTTLESFIDRAQDIHGKNTYDYSKVVYKNTHTKIEIVCPHHGSFFQKPNSHIIQKSGCIKCSRQGHPGRYTEKYFNCIRNKNIAGRFYAVEFSCDTEVFVKIGITKRTPKDRHNGRCGSYAMKIIHDESMSLYEAFKKEQGLIKELSKYKYNPKQLTDGRTECFTIDVVPLIKI